MKNDKLNIIEFFFDKENGSFSLTMNIWILILVIATYFIISYLIKLYKKSATVERNIQLVKLKYKIGGAEVEYEIVRNYQNIEIAHKIYIELITRKAAIEIEEDKDVVVEVYNSWYSLFQITRNELKTISGKLLKDNNTSKELIRLLTDILNQGLRPHLTEFQAKFRKWYSEQLVNTDNLSPQEIQAKYDDIEGLWKSMKVVNKTLIEYSEQLKKIIDG